MFITISLLRLVKMFLGYAYFPCLSHDVTKPWEHNMSKFCICTKDTLICWTKLNFFWNSWRLPYSKRSRRWLLTYRFSPGYSELPARIDFLACNQNIAWQCYQALVVRIRHRSEKSSLSIESGGILNAPLHAAAIVDEPPQAKQWEADQLEMRTPLSSPSYLSLH